MRLNKRHGKGTFYLPDRLAQRLVEKGRFVPAEEPKETLDEQDENSEDIEGAHDQEKTNESADKAGDDQNQDNGAAVSSEQLADELNAKEDQGANEGNDADEHARLETERLEKEEKEKAEEKAKQEEADKPEAEKKAELEKVKLAKSAIKPKAKKGKKPAAKKAGRKAKK